VAGGPRIDASRPTALVSGPLSFDS
jgi:hypothetical protein